MEKYQINNAYELYELIDKIDMNEIHKLICENMRKFRLEQYKEFKEINSQKENPFSVDNISELLGISKVQYKRLENKRDKSKKINLEKLIKLSVIYNKNIEEFFEIKMLSNMN